MKIHLAKSCFPFRGAIAVSLVIAARVMATDYTVRVDCTAERGAVSPRIIGFNAIYCYEPDAPWEKGAGGIPALLTEAGTAILRYPGGTVDTFYHWTNPTGQGWADSWDPHFNPAKNKPASATMSLDEYLDRVKANGITPLVGINMGSGRRFNRVEDGIAEAGALVQHCMKRGAHVEYYYLDNEPYARDANFTYTAEQYAEQLNRYVPALKAVDPGIKIIANLHPGVAHTDYTRTVVRLAGANIDIVDIHMYWRHGSATFAAWTTEPHMSHQRGRPYSEQRAIYRRMFAEEGFPDIEVAVLEWNIGPSGKGNPEPKPAEAALMAGEQFMQYVQSGLKMACFWPMHWEGGNTGRALLSSARGYEPNKVHGMFRQFAGIGGQMRVASSLDGSSAADERLTHLAIKANGGTVLWIYLLNKNQTLASAAVDLDLSTFPDFTDVSAVGFESSDVLSGPLNVHPIPVDRRPGHVSLTMPKNSFAKVMVVRTKAPQVGR